MKLTRHRLTLLLNALYASGTRTIEVSHPSEAVGTLLEIELADPWSSPVTFTQGVLTYADAREEVRREYGDEPYEELPDKNHYIGAMIAGRLVEVANREEIDTFLTRFGYPDLEAGHRPVFAGIDTNLFPWRIQDALGIDPAHGMTDDAGRTPVTGYALSTGVKAELDWHYKNYDAYSLTTAFGEEFERVTDQPAGANRQGFLGLYEYRSLTANRRFDIVETGTGDEAIIEGYVDYDERQENDVVLFSNDYGFVDNARDAGLPAQHVEFPVDLPERIEASWWDIENTLYYLAVIFGVLRLPKVTLYGVWDGKTGKDWQDECLEVVPRSPTFAEHLERDLAIVRPDV